jgi:hypothetical protein
VSTPIEAVVRTANTPAQAKVYVAMLMAEGIPARIDGDSLTDEFAASRRLMNLMGTNVMVPTQSLARAREILQPVAIDPAELERQALAEAPQTFVPPTAATATASGGEANRSWTWWALLLLPMLAALLLAFL